MRHGIVWVCGMDRRPGLGVEMHVLCMQQCQGIVSFHLYHTQAAKTALIEKTGSGQSFCAVTSPFRKSNRFVPQHPSSCNSRADRIIECAPNLLPSWSTGMWRDITISQKALMGTVCLCYAMYVINLHCRAECGPATVTGWMQVLKRTLWFGGDFVRDSQSPSRHVWQCLYLFLLLSYGLQRPKLSEYLKSSIVFPC